MFVPDGEEYSRETLQVVRLDDLDSHLGQLEANLNQMNVQEEALHLQMNERVSVSVPPLLLQRFWVFDDKPGARICRLIIPYAHAFLLRLSTSMSWKSVLRSSAMFPDPAQPLTWGSRGRCSTLSQVKVAASLPMALMEYRTSQRFLDCISLVGTIRSCPEGKAARL